MMYLGMNAGSGEPIIDLAHIRQSVNDILNTPVGSRVMRRDYGSLLSTMIDQPVNDALRLQMMSVAYSAIMRWEPRVVVKALTLTANTTPGSYTADLVCSRADSDETFALSARIGGAD